MYADRSTASPLENRDRCVFCEVAEAPPANHTYGLLPSVGSLTVAEQPDLLWLLDIAPLAPLHSLIVTREHVPAFSYSMESLWAALWQLTATAESAMRALTDQPVLLFEHGVTWCSDKGGCCIDHAHLHLLPCEVDGQGVLRAEGLPLLHDRVTAEAWSGLQDTEYLFCGRSGGGGFYKAEGVRSQYLRELVGQALGVDVWHWHDRLVLGEPQQLEQHINESLRLLRGHLDGRDPAAAVSPAHGRPAGAP